MRNLKDAQATASILFDARGCSILRREPSLELLQGRRAVTAQMQHLDARFGTRSGVTSDFRKLSDAATNAVSAVFAGPSIGGAPSLTRTRTVTRPSGIVHKAVEPVETALRGQGYAQADAILDCDKKGRRRWRS